MNLFLTSINADIEQYKSVLAQITEEITKAFCDDKAYSGPTPQKLKEIIHENTILPEKGLGWETILAKLK